MRVAETSEISWTDATFNAWIGCSHAGPGCDFCYAERDNGRRHWVEAWGPGVPRKRTSAENWKQPLRWNAAAGDFFIAHKRKRRVFAASLADIFDNEVDPAWRADFWALVKATPNLQWLIVTKRIGNARRMLPADWGAGYDNVVLIATVVDQGELDRDGRKLELTPARWRGISVEPMLGPMILGEAVAWLDWVICGGESDGKAKDKPKTWTARPMFPTWPVKLAAECQAAGVAFHFKQWGEWGPDQFDNENFRPIWVAEDGRGTYDGAGADLISGTGTTWTIATRYGKARNGRTLLGATFDGFPGQ